MINLQPKIFIFVFSICLIACSSIKKNSGKSTNCVYSEYDSTRDSIMFEPQGAWVCEYGISKTTSHFEIVYEDRSCLCGQKMEGRRCGMWLLFENVKKKKINCAFFYDNDTLLDVFELKKNQVDQSISINFPEW